MRHKKNIISKLCGVVGGSATGGGGGAVFNGGSLNEGVNHAKNIGGLTRSDLREAILNVLLFVLNFLALAAVVVIVIAGIYLIVGQGSEESKDKAKKMIFYVIVGLVVILFARVIVGLVIFLANSVA